MKMKEVAMLGMVCVLSIGSLIGCAGDRMNSVTDGTKDEMLDDGMNGTSSDMMGNDQDGKTDINQDDRDTLLEDGENMVDDIVEEGKDVVDDAKDMFENER